jgi:hypothetical protein
MLTYAEAPWPDHTEESCNARQLPREVPVSGLSSLCLSLQFLSPTSLRHHPLYHPTSPLAPHECACAPWRGVMATVVR